jgi:hypothetical protein
MDHNGLNGRIPDAGIGPLRDRSYAEAGQRGWPRRLSAAVGGLDVCLLGKDSGDIHLDAEVSDGAFQLHVAEQELTRAEIACAL